MIADRLEDLFNSRACDGFVIMPVTMMLSLEQFCRAVVPELQRRGVFRTEYTGRDAAWQPPGRVLARAAAPLRGAV